MTTHIQAAIEALPRYDQSNTFRPIRQLDNGDYLLRSEVLAALQAAPAHDCDLMRNVLMTIFNRRPCDHNFDFKEMREEDAKLFDRIRHITMPDWHAAPAPGSIDTASISREAHDVAIGRLERSIHADADEIVKLKNEIDALRAHIAQRAASGDAPLRLVDIVSSGHEGWANLIYTGKDWEGGCIAMVPPAVAATLRNWLAAPAPIADEVAGDQSGGNDAHS